MIGVYFAWLAVQSGSLYPSILCHASVNCSYHFVFIPVFLANGITTPDTMMRPLPLLLLAGSLLVFVIGALILHGEFKQRSPAKTA